METRLSAERAKKETRASSTDSDSKGALDDLRALVAAMEATTAEASYFLPAYDARACAETTERLRADLAAAADALAPRRKFSFKARRESKKRSDGVSSDGASARARERTRDEVSATATENAADAVTKKAEPMANAEPNAEPTAIFPERAEMETLAARVAAMSAAADASGFKDAAGETFVFRGGDIELGEAATEAPDLDLERLSGCVVFILGTVRALRCHDLTETKIYGGPVAGSAHVQNLENCHVEIAARQVRVHDARRTRFHVRTKSRPIIEHSREVTFAPFAFAYDGAGAHLAAAGLAEETNAWRDVDDFGWIKNRQSPNWAIALEGERAPPPPPPPR